MIEPPFEHVLALTTHLGMFEHAELTIPRPEHGYCVDDVARLLIILAREPEPDAAARDTELMALDFLTQAQGPDGKVRNRRTAEGHWHGERTVEDCWGRALWAFGTAVRHSPDLRAHALECFDNSAQQRSPHRRAMAFAALGAADVLSVDPAHTAARFLLADAATLIGRPSAEPEWPWPEPRLAYANAALPETLLAAGEHLGRPELIDEGLVLLRWLLDRETLGGHFSPTPVGGAGPGDTAPAFDQQPIEVAAMADACHRAATVTGDSTWLEAIQMAARWFTGDNDAAEPMWDPVSGGGYDGLHAWGPNLNQGAESTLALVSTLQRARQLTSSRR